MIRAVRYSRHLISFLTLVALVLGLIIFTQSAPFKSQVSQFSILATIDFLITIPLLYLLFIRKTKIPKTTVIPVFVLGVLLASIYIPKDQQQLLQLTKQWLVPILEIGVLGFIGYKAYKLFTSYRKNGTDSNDFYSLIKNLSVTNFGTLAGPFLAAELSVFYYGLFVWKKKKLASNEFSYHKKSGTITLFIAFMGIILIETLVLHAVLVKSYPIAAWILTGLSLYTLIQIFGILKSIPQRPITIEKDTLYLRFGIMNETEIPIEAIQSIERTNQEFEQGKNIRYLSSLGALEGHNMIINLREKQTLTGIYGFQKNYQSIALYLDSPNDFENMLNQIKLSKK